MTVFRSTFAVLAATAILAAGTNPNPAPPLSKYQREQQQKFRNSAPADEYFGHLKLSYLEVNNTFRDVAKWAGDHTTDPVLVNRADRADDALGDWAERFPKDPQLARSYYLAAVAHKKVWVQWNQERAWEYLNRLATQFGNTFFGRQAKHDLAAGFTEHYFTVARVCATDTPTATPSPEPTVSATPTPQGRRRVRANATPSPSPSPEPTATPAPAPTVTPTPEPTDVGNGRRAQILTPPCVPPAAPSPTATPSPAAAPSGEMRSPQ